MTNFSGPSPWERGESPPLKWFTRQQSEPVKYIDDALLESQGFLPMNIVARMEKPLPGGRYLVVDIYRKVGIAKESHSSNVHWFYAKGQAIYEHEMVNVLSLVDGLLATESSSDTQQVTTGMWVQGCTKCMQLMPLCQCDDVPVDEAFLANYFDHTKYGRWSRQLPNENWLVISLDMTKVSVYDDDGRNKYGPKVGLDRVLIVSADKCLTRKQVRNILSALEI